MPKPYQLSIPTGLTKSGKDILATVDKACGSGSGGNCIDIDCRVCISFTLDFTFGGALSGIGVITITGTDTGSQYLWEDPPASSPTATIPTSCGGLRIFFQISYDGTATLQIRLNGVLIVSRSSSMRVCEPFVPGDPTEFIYPQPLVDGSEEEGYGPDFTVSGNEDGCNGAASITVTNTSDGAGSGSTNSYDFALDTLLTKGGKRVLAAINCAGSGSASSLYFYGVDTGIRKRGKRVLAGYNPCCGSGPTITTPQPIAGCCDLPPVLYVTFPASMAYLGTMTLTLQTGQRCDNYAPGGATEPVGAAYAGTISSSACGKVWGCLNCVFRVVNSVSSYIFYFGYGDPPAFGSISSGGWQCFLYSCDPVLMTAPVTGKNASCETIFDYATITETAP